MRLVCNALSPVWRCVRCNAKSGCGEGESIRILMDRICVWFVTHYLQSGAAFVVTLELGVVDVDPNQGWEDFDCSFVIEARFFAMPTFSMISYMNHPLDVNIRLRKTIQIHFPRI